MASLNLSANGPSITKSYQSVVSSPTYGQWVVYAVQAPLASAFQQDSSKESVMKVQSTGEGELVDLVEEFSDGRIQFAFVKIKDPNTTLPKNVLIAWCGEGVPERTKGYFTSHMAAVSKLLHGYHVQITARSDRDLSPEGIVQKVADSSGSKYSGGGSIPSAGSKPPPPLASKPVFTPTHIGGGGSGFNPLGRSRAAPQDTNVDEDGWGADAPQVTRTQLERVESAYKPTKVNFGELTSQKQEPSRFATPTSSSNGSGDVVRGAYQPIGKVDIAEIRRQAKGSGQSKDDRPTTVKGSYEPVGKVDIAAIRAKAAAAPSLSSGLSPAATGASGRSDDDDRPKPLSERSAAFNQSERLTTLPKPKVANRFGGGSTFTGTKAPAPGGFTSKPVAAAAPVGTASKTFADEGGKTPAQIWAEKKAQQSGASSQPGVTSPSNFGVASPIKGQPSGEGGWKSGYTGKSWAPVQTTHTGRSSAGNISAQNTGEEEREEGGSPQPGGVGAIRDRFKNAPPPMDMSSKPNAGAPIPIPGLPSRPSQQQIPAEQHANVPPPPAVPRSPSPPSPDMRPSSPVRIAMPVSRTKEPEELSPPEERFSPPPMPMQSIASAARARDPSPEPQIEAEDPARSAAVAQAASTFGAGAAGAGAGAGASAGGGGGQSALVQYDYEKAEDNELELREGEHVHNIEMVDEDWWHGENERGESGLFPSNYVELVEGDGAGGGAAPEAMHAAPAPAAAGPPEPAGGSGQTATAQYDYEAAEDNELSFPDGATILNVEFPDDDWWFGEFGGKTGLFPANYVQLDE